MDIRGIRKRTFYFLAILVVAVLVSFFFVGREKTIQAELNNLKLLPTSEHFTELYFEDPSSLPRNIVSGKRTSFSFTIRNLEGAATDYPYSVYFESPSGKQVMLNTGSVSMSNGASTTVTVLYTFNVSNEQGKMVVSLTGRNQIIDFLIPNNNN